MRTRALTRLVPSLSRDASSALSVRGELQMRRRAAFTLVEILTVIAIIGLLIGLIVPAVSFALTSVRKRALALEVITLSDAIEKYQQKYGDYPPDGSNRAVFERHLRKVFPKIAQTEILLITDYSVASVARNNQAPASWPSGADPRVMDPTEALVFFLGGFSDDPVHPITGAGGPIQFDPATSTAQYRVDRNAPLYDFKQAQLTLEVVGGLTISTEETELGLPVGGNDVLPSYRPSGQSAPYVYFDSRTYSSGGYIGHYTGTGLDGVARPYKSTDLDTTATSDPDRFYRYASPKTFQVICAGLDDDFGGVSPLNFPTVFYQFPTGQQIDISVAPDAQTGPGRYSENAGDGASPQLDNVTSFSEGPLEDALSN